MGDSIRSYKMIKVLGVEGKKVDIIPRVENIIGTCPTELYNKKFEYLGMIIYDKKWKKFVLFELNKEMQMSKDCIDEAFKLTKEYWEEKTSLTRQ